jgi:hypothetical protein
MSKSRTCQEGGGLAGHCNDCTESSGDRKALEESDQRRNKTNIFKVYLAAELDSTLQRIKAETGGTVRKLLQ